MATSQRNPTVYVIAGPNGAGKTTFATRFLPGFANCRQFLNADLIAAGLSPFAPETQNRRAGRLLLERIDELAAAREDFGFETTLSGRTYGSLLKGLGRDGYRIVLFFLWLPTADLAVFRVANRVRQGGHSVPESDVRRRYVSGLRNFFHLYRPLADAWWFFEASTLPPVVIARQDGDLETIEQAGLFDEIQKSIGAETAATLPGSPSPRRGGRSKSPGAIATVSRSVRLCRLMQKK